MNHNHAAALRAYARACGILALIVLSGCSLPRIIFLNDPLSVEEHNALGRIYESQEQSDLAAQQYRAALQKDPQFVPSLLLLGDLSYRTRRYSEAESAYTKAAKLQPDNGDIYNNLCWVYLEQHAGMEKAEDLIRKALTLTPEHRAYYLDTLGVILLRKGRIAESVAALDEALELMPKDKPDYLAEVYLHKAEAYRSAGDTSAAGEAEQSAEKYRAAK